VSSQQLTWPELLQQWQQQLQKLAQDFIAGDARVAPLEGEQTCRYCDLSLLCRLRSAS
jgi:ATP-dependent helicase/DNAse subunit B